MSNEAMLGLVEMVHRSSQISLRDQLYHAAARYAGLRADWALADPAGREALDALRRAAHDAFIDACNILSRNMAERGESIEWRRELGDDRKTIGDFACWLSLSLALSAR
jgi:hypothetical protein